MALNPRLIAIGAIFGLFVVGAFYFTGMVDRVWTSLSSLTTQYHYIDKIEAIQFIAKNPAGIGMGLAGPREGLFFLAAPVYHVESTLAHFALDMGIWGLALWLTFFGSILVFLWRQWSADIPRILKSILFLAILIWSAMLTASIFLPVMQSLALMAWVWFFSALGVTSGRIMALWTQGSQ